MARVLLVGGGLTSAVTATLIRQTCELANIELCVWDKARGFGGRMSTSRLSSNKNSNCLADLGAQYITATPHYASLHSKYYDELKSSKLLTPLKLPIENKKSYNDGTTDYICPLGSSSLVKHFFNKSHTEVNFGMRVSKIENDAKLWRVYTETGDVECFDALILTIPVPQVLELLGNSPGTNLIGNNETSQLEKVQYSSRYAIALLFDGDNEKEQEIIKNEVKLKDGACAKYIYDDGIFRYVSLDSYKRNNTFNAPDSDKVPLSVVFHTSVPFGIKHVEQNPDDMKPLLLKHIKELFPDWPEPTAVKCQKWRYSQVRTPYPGEPGCVELHKGPLLLIGGDAFTHSNFDGCIDSAEALANSFVSSLHT